MMLRKVAPRLMPEEEFDLMRIESAVVFVRHDVLCEMDSLWLVYVRLMLEMDISRE